MKYKKGDIVKSPQGYEAEVTWARDGKVGVQFTENAKDHEGGMVYQSSDLEMVKKALHVPRSKPYKEMSVEELREEIRSLRNGRKESIKNQRGRKKSKKKSTKSKSKETKKKDPLAKLEGKLDSDLIQKLKNNIKKGD